MFGELLIKNPTVLREKKKIAGHIPERSRKMQLQTFN